MTACNKKPIDMKSQIIAVGRDLVNHYGKKKFYSTIEVKEANKRQGINVDFACWSHSVFNSHLDFDQHHSAMGETCDYIAMKTEAVESISTSMPGATLFDFDLSWLEFPDIDWPSFDFLDISL